MAVLEALKALAGTRPALDGLQTPLLPGYSGRNKRIQWSLDCSRPKIPAVKTVYEAEPATLTPLTAIYVVGPVTTAPCFKASNYSVKRVLGCLGGRSGRLGGQDNAADNGPASAGGRLKGGRSHMLFHVWDTSCVRGGGTRLGHAGLDLGPQPQGAVDTSRKIRGAKSEWFAHRRRVAIKTRWSVALCELQIQGHHLE
jgi:hypothetical protein